MGTVDPPPRPRRKPGPPPSTGRRPIRHGTHAGYVAHRRRDEPACRACLTAHAAFTALHAPILPPPEPRLCPRCGDPFDPRGFCAHVRACAGRGRLQPIRAVARPAREPIPFLPVADLAFACACGHTFPVADGINQLVAHVVAEHHRPPTRDERTPKPARKDAA